MWRHIYTHTCTQICTHLKERHMKMKAEMAEWHFPAMWVWYIGMHEPGNPLEHPRRQAAPGTADVGLLVPGRKQIPVV